MYVAHKREDGKEQSVMEHLTGTACLAKQFARQFGAGNYAYQLGLAHDIGKYSQEFQKRILHNGAKVDHSTAGAKELANLRMMPAALCAAGHHTGLPDFGGRKDSEDLPTLMGRLKRKVKDYHDYQQDLALHPVPLPDFQSGFDLCFFTRMLFSSLVDADYLDTERFMAQDEVDRGGYDSVSDLFAALERFIGPWWNPKEPINQKRCEILEACLKAGKGERGVYTLTVPTGGGKTVSSLAFALQHAVKHELRRVIYVIPYTSIIEQTADQFRSIVGDRNVLEHHSNVNFGSGRKDDDEDRLSLRHRLSAENWDAPIVVTTNVQFFESLFSNRSSHCRKLHNLTNSVIVFDEAQMLPLPYLKPCVRAIETLSRDYGTTAVLCTATQPSLEKLFWGDGQIREICPNTKELYDFFRRTTVRHMGKRTLEEVARRMEENPQALAIVGTRKQARQLFASLPPEGRFHLSTLMAPVHRKQVIKEIRRRLKEGESCRVAATSLIEAGVDVDFPVVLRGEAGLDSIVQAAGRCNREGKRPAGESMVWVFQTEDPPPRLVRQSIVMLHEVMEQFEDLSSPKAIRAYFDALHQFKGKDLDEKGILDAFEKGRGGCAFPFAQVAQDFRLIDTNTKTVVIPWDQQAEELCAKLRHAISRTVLRQAGPYSVNLYPQHFRALQEAGDIELLGDDLAILSNQALYDQITGLSLEADYGKALFG